MPIWIILWGGLLASTLYADRHKVSKDLADNLGRPSSGTDKADRMRLNLVGRSDNRARPTDCRSR